MSTGVPTHLFLGGRQHGDDGEADGLDGERGTPVLGQDGEADVPVAVDVRVHGNVVTHKDNLKEDPCQKRERTLPPYFPPTESASSLPLASRTGTWGRT